MINPATNQEDPNYKAPGAITPNTPSITPTPVSPVIPIPKTTAPVAGGMEPGGFSGTEPVIPKVDNSQANGGIISGKSDLNGELTKTGTQQVTPGGIIMPNNAPITPKAEPVVPVPTTTTSGTAGVDSIVDQMFPKGAYSDDERAAMKEALSGKNPGEVATFMAQNEKDKYAQSQKLLDAYRTTRDFGLTQQRTKTLNDQKTVDLTQEYDDAILRQKQNMDATANNLGIAQGTAGRLQSRNMQNAITQELDNSKRIYQQLISNKERDIQRLGEDLKYANTIASNEYNDKVNQSMQEMLSGIQALDKTGALASAQGLVQARSFLDATISNTMKHQEDYYNKLSYISQRFDQYHKEAAEASKVDDNTTKLMNDGYLYNAQGLRVKNESGAPIKVASTSGTLLTKEPITMNDGSKAFVYQNPDGTTRVEKIQGTGKGQYEIPAEMQATYAKLFADKKISVKDLTDMGFSSEQVMNIVGNVDTSTSTDWERTTMKVYNEETGNYDEKIVFTNKKGQIKDPTTGDITNSDGTKAQAPVDANSIAKFSTDKRGKENLQCGELVNDYILKATGVDPKGQSRFVDSYKSKIIALNTIGKSDKPQEGGIFVMNTGSATGHTGIVTKVNDDGSIEVLEANANGRAGGEPPVTTRYEASELGSMRFSKSLESGTSTAGTSGNIPDKNNNPGNLKMGDVGHGVDAQGHTIFGSVQDGAEALVKDLISKQTGNTRTGLKGASSLTDMAKVYAGDWQNWLKNVTAISGYKPTSQLKDIDMKKLAPAIAKSEGFTGSLSFGGQSNLSSSEEKTFAAYDGKNIEQLTKNITGKKVVSNKDIQAVQDKYSNYLEKAKNELSPEEESLVEGLKNYTLDPSKLPGGMSKEGQAAKKRILAAAFKDANYDMKKYPTRQKFVNNWTSGAMNTNNNAIVTVTGHLMELKPALEALENGNFQKFNELWNSASTQVGAPETNDAKIIANAVASEMAKVYKGGNAVATEKEIDDFKHTIETKLSSGQQKGMIKTLSNLMLSKIKANAESYRRTMEEKPENIFDTEQTKFLKSQGVNVFDAFTSKKGDFTYDDGSKIEFDGNGKYRYTPKGGSTSDWQKEGTNAIPTKASQQTKINSLNETLGVATATPQVKIPPTASQYGLDFDSYFK